MVILYNLGGSGSFRSLQASLQSSLQAWAFQRLMLLDLASGDIRWALLGLLSRLLAAAADSLVQNILRRAVQGARFAGAVTAADTMLAAGGR